MKTQNAKLPTVRTVQIRGHVVRALRLKKGWTVAELAEKAICSETTIIKCEESCRVLVATLAKIAKALGIECQELLSEPQADTPALADPPLRKTYIEVVIKLPVDLSTYDETNPCINLLNQLLRLIAARGELNVSRISNGSVEIAFTLTPADFDKLQEALDVGTLPIDEISEITLLRVVNEKPQFGYRSSIRHTYIKCDDGRWIRQDPFLPPHYLGAAYSDPD